MTECQINVNIFNIKMLDDSSTSDSQSLVNQDGATSHVPKTGTDHSLCKDDLNEICEHYCHTLHTTRMKIEDAIDLTENLDLNITIITYKVYEKQHEFKTKIDQLKEDRKIAETNSKLTKSELSLKVNDFQICIDELRNKYDDLILNLNKEKIEHQEHIEEIITALDVNFVKLQVQYSKLVDAIEQQKLTASESETHLLTEKYKPEIDQFQRYIQEFGKKQDHGWKIENSETKLSALLEEHGLRVTKSGLLLTKSGHCITYDEAQAKGYFQALEIPYHKLLPYMRRDVDPGSTSTSDQSSESTKSTSVLTKMSSEDCKYLKSMVGRPLALALAEITSKQPRDPVHYLGHFLFKYRYNQEIEQIQKDELDALDKERQRLAKERWDKMILEDSKRIVFDLIIKAEELAFQNELKRIEAEMATMAAEDEENYDEARDKFEETLYGSGLK